MSLSIEAKKINFLLKYYDIKPADFADNINIKRASVSHIQNGRSNPSLGVIQKILIHYTDINPMWLLGKDENMLLSDPNFIPNLDEKEEEIEEEIIKNTPSPISQIAEKNEEQDDLLKGYTEVKEESTIPMSALSSIKDKKIAKIVIFYTDKTMESYEPN